MRRRRDLNRAWRQRPRPEAAAAAPINQLDGRRNPFIETEEREELFEALNDIVDAAEAEHGRTFDTARQHLIAGVEGVRDW
jgi:hypothetical protein